MVEKKRVIPVVLLIAVYVLFANARTQEVNPFIDGATLAVHMIVPALAGILYGARAGLIVGALGALGWFFTPTGSELSLLMIAPHAGMGYLAGIIRKRFPVPVAAFAIIPGHLLSIIATMIGGLFDWGLLSKVYFFQALAYESFIGIIAVIILAEIYRLALE